jgi:hypothetical protein
VPGSAPSRSSTLIAALGDGPASTSDLYDRVGYPSLVRAGLVQYASFRAALVQLEAAGLVTSEPASDGSTLWRRISKPAASA